MLHIVPLTHWWVLMQSAPELHEVQPLPSDLQILCPVAQFGHSICSQKSQGPYSFLGLFGFILGLDVTLYWMRTGTVVRMASVVLSVLLIIGAMQFFTLGLVADMIKGLRRRRLR